jgi:hypothetical protein
MKLKFKETMTSYEKQTSEMSILEIQNTEYISTIKEMVCLCSA